MGGLFHVVNDIERIGDHAKNIADSAVLRKERNIKFSDESFNELREMMELINENVHICIEVFAHHKEYLLPKIEVLEEQVDVMERQIQQAHIDRLKRNECTPDAGMLFSDIVSGLERVSDHAVNIAYSMVKENASN